MSLETNEFTGLRRVSSENASALAAAGWELLPTRNSLQTKAIARESFQTCKKQNVAEPKIPTRAELLRDGELKHSLHRVVGFVSARRQSKRPQSSTQGISKTIFAPARCCYFGKEFQSNVINFRRIFCKRPLVRVPATATAEVPDAERDDPVDLAHDAVSSPFPGLEERNR
jgi:hypothetical protein